MGKKNRPVKKNILVKIYRFFFPKDFYRELQKGMVAGQEIKSGKRTLMNFIPSYWIGKGIRKAIDPKHKLHFGGKDGL